MFTTAHSLPLTLSLTATAAVNPDCSTEKIVVEGSTHDAHIFSIRGLRATQYALIRVNDEWVIVYRRRSANEEYPWKYVRFDDASPDRIDVFAQALEALTG